jgi:hypothetical protein
MLKNCSSENYYERTGYRVPVYAITFGNSEESQPEDIDELTFGDAFDGIKDLWETFVKAKGNNRSD